MKIYIIKHKGANTFGNLCAFGSRCRVENEFFYRGHYFFRYKDAKKYLKQGSSTPENYEIIPLKLPKKL